MSLQVILIILEGIEFAEEVDTDLIEEVMEVFRYNNASSGLDKYPELYDNWLLFPMLMRLNDNENVPMAWAEEVDLTWSIHINLSDDPIIPTIINYNVLTKERTFSRTREMQLFNEFEKIGNEAEHIRIINDLKRNPNDRFLALIRVQLN